MSRTIEVTDKTIDNHMADNHKRAKNWVSIVLRNKAQRGGLDRAFLDRGDGHRVMVCGDAGRSMLQPGICLEFAGDYVTSGGRRQRNREYVRVTAVAADSITIEEIELDQVDDKPGLDPERPWRDVTSPELVITLEQIQEELEKRGDWL